MDYLLKTIFSHSNNTNIKSIPLMPRSLLNDMKDISFEDYLLCKPQSNFVKTVNKVLPELIKPKDFDNKIQYLIETVTDLKTKRKEIIELWEICFQMISEDEEFDIFSINSDFLFALVSITGEAELDTTQLYAIDSQLNESIKVKFKEVIKEENNFDIYIAHLTFWQKNHIKYLIYLGIGLVYNELAYLKSIIEKNRVNFESLKTTSPLIFIEFINAFKLTDSKIDTYRLQYQELYIQLCLEQIIIARNTGNYFEFDCMLSDYYSEKYYRHKYLNWVFKNFIGYGEKPWRLVKLFVLVNFIFCFIFTFSCLKFHFATEPQNKIEKFVTFISFNNTTMLTIGYGDIYPDGIGARIMVMILQILGFAISGTAIALFLKKILRF